MCTFFCYMLCCIAAYCTVLLIVAHSLFLSFLTITYSFLVLCPFFILSFPTFFFDFFLSFFFPISFRNPIPFPFYFRFFLLLFLSSIFYSIFSTPIKFHNLLSIDGKILFFHDYFHIHSYFSSLSLSFIFFLFFSFLILQFVLFYSTVGCLF
jgi:hypothetical protein